MRFIAKQRVLVRFFIAAPIVARNRTIRLLSNKMKIFEMVNEKF